MSSSSEQLLIQLQRFLYDYEESHNQSTTICNPWPGDGAVCILLCELVKMSQNIEVWPIVNMLLYQCVTLPL